jgi:hypothetical protein
VAEVGAGDYYAIVPEWVLFSDVSAQAIRLYAVLRRYADKGSGVAHPSRRALADKINVKDLKTVDTAIKQLAELGAVVVTERFTESGDRDSNGYFLPRTPHDVSGRNGQGGGADSPTVGEQNGQQEPQAVKPQNSSSKSDRKTDNPPGFAEFYAAYPKKEARPDAVRAWVKATKSTDPQVIMSGLRRFPFSADRQYVPQPARWLNANRWADEVPRQAEDAMWNPVAAHSTTREDAMWNP